MMLLCLPERCSLSTLDNVYWCDALTYLRALPDGYVNCIVTSPPYFGLRDYGVGGQIGLEDTPQAFVKTMVELFREARRVLRDDGVAWINLGDSYNNYGTDSLKRAKTSTIGLNSEFAKEYSRKTKIATGGLNRKQLLGIPWRVAFGLQDDGWILRSDMIWHKPNPMPESVTDRPTKSHEYCFLLAKSERYWYDADAIREPSSPTSHGSPNVNPGWKSSSLGNSNGHTSLGKWTDDDRLMGRNKRSVWIVATEPTPFAHFATFPQKLIEPMILAGCPHKVCAVCGAGYVRQIEVRGGSLGKSWHNHSSDLEMGMSQAPTVGRRLDAEGNPYTRKTLGFIPQCTCASATHPGIVLDMFMGSGTTGLVARRLGRHYIGCDLNGEYVQLARRRLSEPYTMPFPQMLEVGA